MIRGLRTAIYPMPDLARGKEWYSQVLERDPYFDEPFYVGFSAGGFELGLIPDGEALQRRFGPEAADVLYEAMDDAQRDIDRFFGGDGQGTAIEREPESDAEREQKFERDPVAS